MPKTSRTQGPRRRMGRPPRDFSARAQILAGAVRAFGEHGYARASVRHILQESGVSRRTFYLCFRSKEQVFDAIFRSGVEAVLGLVRGAISATRSPPDKLAAGIDAYLGAHVALGRLARVLLTEQFAPGSKFHRRREEAVEAFIQLIEEEYRGIRSKRVDPLLVRGIVAGIDYIAVTIASSPKPAEWDLERAKRVMLRMLAASLAEPGDPVPPLPLEPE